MTIVWLLNSFFLLISSLDDLKMLTQKCISTKTGFKSVVHSYPFIQNLFYWDSISQYDILISQICFCFVFFFFHSEFNLIPCNSEHAIFIVDPLTAIQAGTIWRGKVHVHFWWIVHVSPYSIWIESLFEGQWFSSVRVFPQHSFFRGEEYL